MVCVRYINVAVVLAVFRPSVALQIGMGDTKQGITSSDLQSDKVIAAASMANPAFEKKCSNCDCVRDGGWLGCMKLEDCAAKCTAQGKTTFKHASGTKSSGGKGDNNCACCTSAATQQGDGGGGVDVYLDVTYRLGSNGTNSCPSGYASLLKRDACPTAAKAVEEHFVGDYDYDDAPDGCFVSEAAVPTKVYFNNKIKHDSTRRTAPWTTPICEHA